MKASFDGMRRNATNGMNNLYHALKEVIECAYIDDDFLKERLIETYNSAAQSVDIMNCLYDPNVEGDMNDLSDILSVKRFEEDED